MTHAIETRDVSFSFDEDPVLMNLDLRVPRGSVYGLLGRNGSGKTTLANLLLGVLRAESGRCEVLGLDPEIDTIEIRRRVGYVPQEADFDPQMTVEQTLRFLSSFYPDHWRRELEEDYVDRFGLAEKRSTTIDKLSGGLRQRLALIAALVIEPEILVLDEPTANLDAVIRRDFAEAVIDFMTREGRSVLLLSHLLHEVERLADHVGILHEGELLVEAPVERLKQDFLRLTARFTNPPRDDFPGVVSLRCLGERWRISAWAHGKQERARLLGQLEQEGAVDIDIAESSLESIFVDLVEGESHA